MVTLELTDQEAEKFKEFRKYQQDLEAKIAEHANWKQLKSMANDIQYGTFFLVIKEGIPVRIDKPVQQIVLGVKL